MPSFFSLELKNLGSVQIETHFSPLLFKGATPYLMGVFQNPYQSSFHKRQTGHALKPEVGKNVFGSIPGCISDRNPLTESVLKTFEITFKKKA